MDKFPENTSIPEILALLASKLDVGLRAYQLGYAEVYGDHGQNLSVVFENHHLMLLGEVTDSGKPYFSLGRAEAGFSAPDFGGS